MSRHGMPMVVLIGLGLASSACGYSPGDRAVSGGLIGAGTGAAVGAIAGGNIGTAALIGAESARSAGP